MKLNLSKWKSTVLAVEKHIRMLKVIRDEPGQPNWPDQGYKLASFKSDANALYTVRAHLRGKQHVKVLPEDQEMMVRNAIVRLVPYKLTTEEAEVFVDLEAQKA